MSCISLVQVLLSIKAMLNDPNGALLSWDELSVDPCSWSLVTCSSENCVISLLVFHQVYFHLNFEKLKKLLWNFKVGFYIFHIQRWSKPEFFRDTVCQHRKFDESSHGVSLLSSIVCYCLVKFSYLTLKILNIIFDIQVLLRNIPSFICFIKVDTGQ